MIELLICKPSLIFIFLKNRTLTHLEFLQLYSYEDQNCHSMVSYIICTHTIVLIWNSDYICFMNAQFSAFKWCIFCIMNQLRNKGKDETKNGGGVVGLLELNFIYITWILYILHNYWRSLVYCLYMSQTTKNQL